MTKTLTVALSSLALGAFLSLPAHAASASGPVTCTDGTTAAHGGRGACSKHGGIKKDAAAAAGPAMKASASKMSGTKSSSSKASNTDPTGAIAKCKDGTYSHSKTHTGSCSRHGGVDSWMDGSSK